MIKRIIFIAVMSAFVAAPAMADLIGTADVQHTGVGPYEIVTLYGRSYQGIGVYAGVYHQTITNSTVGGLADWGFCIEMQGSTSSNQPYNVLTLWQAPVNQGPGGNPMGVTKADYIRELWAIVDPSPTMTAVQAAAMQAAIWEIVYEDSGLQWDVSSYNAGDTMNSFKIAGSTDVINQANTWLGQLNGEGTLANLVALSNDAYQDYVVVPVPAAVLLGMLGLSVAGIKLRKYA